jgi:hypothetical protein
LFKLHTDKNRLLEFTAKISHGRLPQKVQDLIVDHLFPDARSCRPIYVIQQALQVRPRFLDPELVDPRFGRKVVTHLYKKFPHSVEDDGWNQTLEEYFTTDNFGFYVEPIDVPIHSLDLTIWLSPDNAASIRECFRFLPRIQTIPENFQLKLRFDQEYGPFADVSDARQLWDELKGVVAHFQERGHVSVEWSSEEWDDLLPELLESIDDIDERRLLAGLLGEDP